MDKLKSFDIPNRLYGREQEIACLLDAYDRVGSGHGEVMLVRGASGTGKTSLVNELRNPVRNRNGFFIRGKFNQYQQNSPYFAFRQALGELCNEFLQADLMRRQRFRSAILQVVGKQGQLLVELAPEFELLLGEQPPLDIVSPQEARHRFAELLRNFFRAVCRPEHPVIMFLDDWQWSDPASAELLRQLQIGITLPYLLVVASYRDNDIASDHPFLATIADLRAQHTPVTTLTVTDITQQHVHEIILDAMNQGVESADELTTIVYRKTGGNPFFVRSFLRFLFEQEMIWHDLARNCWQWRILQCEDHLPGNIVDLFIMKLQRLDAELGSLLSLAACLGNRFDIHSLCVISGLESQTCHSLLNSSAAKTVVSMLNEKDNTYVFVHDRLQQAAYMLIAPENRAHILLKIGRLLLNSLSPDQLQEKIFEVTDLFYVSHDLIDDTDERIRVIKLKMQAANKAYAATAYIAALTYFRGAARFLQEPEFGRYFLTNYRAMALDLFKKLGDCEFLTGIQSEAEAYINRAVSLAESVLEKADALCILIVQQTLLARYPEAIATGRRALESLDVTLPDDDYETARDREIDLVRQALQKRSVASLADLPLMTDPEKLMIGKILITLGPPCYRSHQRLWSVIVPKVVNLTINYGAIPQVGYSHTAFGGLLGWVDDDYATACEFGKLATRLMTETFTTPSDQSVFYLMIGSSIRHWSQHLRYGSQDYHDAYEIGLRSGNLQYAAYAFGHNMYCRFYQGAPFSQLIPDSQRALEFSRVRLNKWASDLLEGGLHLFGRLSGEASETKRVRPWSEQEYRVQLEEHSNIQVLTIYLVLKAFYHLVMGEEQEALQLSEEAEPLIYTVGTQGLLPWPEHVMARILILTSLYPGADLAQQTAWRSELDRMIARLGVWAENCPDNFRHKHLLVRAELARIEGRTQEALRLYDEAIDAARAGDFLQWTAITNERASRFFLEAGNETVANSYWQQAYICYQVWGATAKVRAMEAAFAAAMAEKIPATDDMSRARFVEKQLSLLRTFAVQTQQSALQANLATQAQELGDATRQLRIEIAERRRAEQEIRRLNDILAESQHIAHIGSWEIDLATNALYWSDETYLIHETTPAEFTPIVEAAIAFYAPESIPLISAAVKEAIEEGKDFQMELDLITAKGRPIKVYATSKVVRENGVTSKIVGVFQDITERKLLEEKLRQSLKMESVGRLAGGVAHDFNNQLSVVLGYAELLKLNFLDNPQVLEQLTEISKSAEHSRDITAQLLTFSRQQLISPKTMNLNAAIKGTQRTLPRLIGEDILLSYDLADNLWNVRMDGVQLDQILMNLTLNARDAMPKGGELVIATANTIVDQDFSRQSLDAHPGEYVLLSTGDNGCGMDKETLKHLFEPFYTTKGLALGTGLGLATVYGIVTQNHGFITVDSAPGVGTKFNIYLPRLADEIRIETREAEACPTGTGTILLVEDDETVRKMTASLLEHMGYQVISTDTPVDAIRFFEEATTRIDLVLTDVIMPGMNGKEMMDRIKVLRPGTRFLFMSGYSSEVIEQKGVTEGIVHFIQKPFAMSHMNEKIKEAIEST